MRIRYFLSETLTNLKRNVLMTAAAVSTVAISLLLLGGVQILGMLVANVTDSWEAKVEVSVYLLKNATEGEIGDLNAEISAMPEVRDVTFVSQAEAMEEFKRQYADKPEFFEALPPDALPASFRIGLHNADDSELVSVRLNNRPGVDDVEYGGEVIKRLLQVNALLRTITLVMSVILMIAAAALIANTIRLAIYARRDEIGIMKLVGATNWFIRIPFMLEGLLAALVGALVAGLIVVGANQLLFSRVGEFVEFLGPVFSFSASEIGSVLLVLGGVAALVGLIGSTMALRRFLEV